MLKKDKKIKKVNKKKKKLKIKTSSIFTGIFIALIAYFSFYFLFGTYGFLNFSSFEQQAQIKKENLDTLTNENLAKEHRIKLLKSETLDKDMLDEQVRENLGYIDKDEIVIYYSPNEEK